MKLLYIHQYFTFPEQSGGTRSYDLATSFHKKGIEVFVVSSTNEFSSDEKGKRWSEFEREGIRFYILNCKYDNKMSFLKRICAFMMFMCFASIKSLKIECDVILATSTPLTIAVPALICKWIKKTPFIFEIRDVWPEVPIKMGFIKNKLMVKFLYWFESIVYRNATWLVPLSSGMAENIQLRFPYDKLTVIPNISELNRFKNIEKEIDLPISLKEKKVVLYAGTLGYVNGLKYIVDLAYYTLQIDSSIVYLIYGKGKERDVVLNYAMEKGVLNKTLFYGGSVAKEELPYLYSICTIGSSFVINNPVLWDNSANKFFDTLAASKPILINHKGWQAQTIINYNVGYVLPEIISAHIASEFVNYLNNRSLLKTQTLNSYYLAQNEFSLDVAVNKYLNIFDSLTLVIK